MRRRTVKDTEGMTPEKRAEILTRFRASLNPTPKAAQRPPARITPPADVIPRAAPTPAVRSPAQKAVFILPPKRPPPQNLHHQTPDRAADIAAQERFLAERGATHVPPSNDPTIMSLPDMTFDRSTKKWTRRAP